MRMRVYQHGVDGSSNAFYYANTGQEPFRDEHDHLVGVYEVPDERAGEFFQRVGIVKGSLAKSKKRIEEIAKELVEK